MSKLVRCLVATSVAVATVVLTPIAAQAQTPRQRLDALVRQRSASSTSVTVTDVTARRTLSAGAGSGMITASVVKLELLETLLVIRQGQHRRPSATERGHLVPMIEHSSNADATWIYNDVGGRAGVSKWENTLGLLKRLTVIGRDGYWGLTTTSGAQQAVLLGNLVNAHSPLNKANRAYALRLMRNVQRDQRWGVPVVATSGTPANKNGWLGVGADHYRWAVNSVGIVTVHGRVLLVAVMTQHDHDYASGIQRVEQLARAAVAAEQAG